MNEHRLERARSEVVADVLRAIGRPETIDTSLEVLLEEQGIRLLDAVESDITGQDAIGSSNVFTAEESAIFEDGSFVDALERLC